MNNNRMNKPFISNFIDYFKPEESINEYTEYSPLLSLNVLKGTETPATSMLDLEEETFTKAHQEVTDLCSYAKVNFIKLLEGETLTLVAREETDLSLKNSFSRLISLLEGETYTRSSQDTSDVK